VPIERECLHSCLHRCDLSLATALHWKSAILADEAVLCLMPCLEEHTTRQGACMLYSIGALHIFLGMQKVK